MVWAAECELGKVSRQEVRVAKLASQRVVFGELRHRDDRHGAAEQATPFLHVVEPARDLPGLAVGTLPAPPPAPFACSGWT